MQVTSIGTGYVVRVSGICFSEFSFEDVCVDLDADQIDVSAKGVIPVYDVCV